MQVLCVFARPVTVWHLPSSLYDGWQVVVHKHYSPLDGDATPENNGAWIAADKARFQGDCRAMSSKQRRVLKGCGADVKHTVTEGRQGERQGYCQSLTAAQSCKKHTAPATEKEKMEGGEMLLLFLKGSDLKVWNICMLNQVQSSCDERPGRGTAYLSWFLSRRCDVGLSRQGDGNEHRRWSVGPIDTCAGPWALRRSPLLLLLLLLCHLSVSSMVSSHGLLLRYNHFHLPVKPPGRPRSGTKDSESEKEKEGRRDFSLQYKHISSLPSPPLEVPRQTKSKCCRVTFLFLSGIL